MRNRSRISFAKAEFMDITHISVSRKKCFDTCAQQYKYRYHLKLPRPGEEPIYFIYGKIVHKIAEEYVRLKGEQSVGDISKDVLRGKIEIEDGQVAPELPPDYKRKLTRHLRAIQNLTERIGYDGQLEYPFRYDLDPPHEKNIVGFLDRLIIRGDKAWIIDYKTTKKGKWRVNSTTVKQDLQLRAYARVVQREFGLKPENISAALYYLEGEEIVSAKYSEASLILVEKDLLDAYDEIKAADPDKVWGRVGWHCKNCDYATVCPFYTADNKSNAPKDWDGDLTVLGDGSDHWGG